MLRRIAVVTHPDDHPTQEVCRRFSRNVECVTTNEMYSGSDAFNKGRAINCGLKFLAAKGWVLILDADIVLPADFARSVSGIGLKPEKIFGCDRLDIYGYDKFEALRAEISAGRPEGYILNPPAGLTLGSRFIHWQHGYIPVGYFQLFHSSTGRIYPQDRPNAGESDVAFASNWARTDRILIPDLFVYHLCGETQAIPLGKNWSGRRSPPFLPS